VRQLQVGNHVFPPLLHFRPHYTMLYKMRIEQIAFLLYGFNYVLLQVGDHYFSQFFKIVVYHSDAIFSHCALPQPQDTVLLHEFLFVDVGLFDIGV
jgi:hypothetical protein